MGQDKMNTHNLRCDFGRHRGELYTRMPVHYLKWMVNERHSRADIAQAELDRRGTTTPEFEVSGHAIDRVSQLAFRQWQEERNGDEGIHAWICRLGKEALAVEPDEKGRRTHQRLVWIFSTDTVWPVLKTVRRAKRKE